MKTRLAALATVATFAACGPPGPDVADFQTYLVYDYDPDANDYHLHEAEIRTLTTPQRVDGELAFLRGGGSLVTVNPDPNTREEFAEMIEVRGHREPSAEYLVRDDVAIPYDFDTQMMVTLYHHLERANDYFEGAGFDTDRIGRLPVYYSPQVSVLGLSLPLLTDNAAYAFTLDAFIIPPRVVLTDDVPLMANRGVIVHEYGHAVFNRIVLDDQRAPDIMFTSYTEQARNEIRSLDEGLADLFAALALEDPDFISPSISAEEFEIDRDLSRKRIWDVAFNSEVLASLSAPGGPNPYLLGSLIASTLWAARDFLDDDTLARVALETMGDIRLPQPSFQLWDFFNAFLDRVPPDTRDQTCDLFRDRLPLIEMTLDC